ncbi:MAG: sulfur oxidation c-type cytochrome SoxA [Pseudomonadales bacterium]|jgi:sulfur-oxidizing protein SoxA|nr:sulfur oxidation c-type cytochrome SoxA [Pseudomonadales bacterium]
MSLPGPTKALWAIALALLASCSGGASPGRVTPDRVTPDRVAPDRVAPVTPEATPSPAGRSGYSYMGAELRALQDDSFANPGMLWVDRGATLWNEAPGGGAQRCADCHGEPSNLAGVAARLPAWSAARSRLENLEMRINVCRTLRQGQDAWPWESEPLLAMTTLVAHQSRGTPLDVRIDGPAAAAFARGQREFERERGQLGLACSDCHSRYAGARLRGDLVSEGMINGFPIYRLTWQTLGSRQRMFRWCNEAVRAEPYPAGHETYLDLELYLAWRARGLPIETPAVRR